jgi:hypothetical protein
MTVKYASEVATSHFWTLHKLMFRWRGSIWKLVWVEMVIWCVVFAALSALYRFALDDDQRKFVILTCAK